MKRFSAGLTFLLLILLALAGCNGGGSNSPVAKSTQFGPVEGVDDTAASGTYFWMGVPFAKPPVEALRWKAPVDPARWSTAVDDDSNSAMPACSTGASTVRARTTPTTLRSARR